MRTLALFSVLVFAFTFAAHAGPKLDWGTFGVGMAIPDDDSTGISYSVNVTDHFIIDDLNVKIQIFHNEVSDLDIVFRGPDGTRVHLWDNACGFSNDMNVIFDDEAGRVDCGDQDLGFSSFKRGSAFKNLLSDFDGMDAFGEWTITVADVSNTTEGEFSGLQLIFKEDRVTPRLDSLETDLTAVTTDVEMIKTDVGMVKTDVATANTSLVNLQSSVDEVQTNVATANAGLVNLQVSVDGVQVDVTEANTRLVALQSSVDDVLVEIAVAQEQLVNLQTDLTMVKDTVEMLEMASIERALWNREPLAIYSMPDAVGGKLEIVRGIVISAIAQVQNAGQNSYIAATFVSHGDDQFALNDFRNAFQFYASAYCLAVSPEWAVQKCFE